MHLTNISQNELTTCFYYKFLIKMHTKIVFCCYNRRKCKDEKPTGNETFHYLILARPADTLSRPLAFRPLDHG